MRTSNFLLKWQQRKQVQKLRLVAIFALVVVCTYGFFHLVFGAPAAETRMMAALQQVCFDVPVSVCVCLCLSVSVCVYVCVCICMCRCLSVYVPVSMSLCLCLYVCAFVYVRVFMFMCLCAYIMCV
jgi:hypothetical protein